MIFSSNWLVLISLAVISCAHKKARPLKFYHIAKDIQHGTNFGNNSIDRDLHIPPQVKNIAILLSQRQPHYNDIGYGFKVYQQTRPTELRLRVLRGQHRSARLTHAIHQRKVHGIITDLPRAKMRNFMPVCHDYHVPILYLGQRRKDDPYLLRSIYPDLRQLVHKAIAEMKGRGFQQIAMLNNTQNAKLPRYVRRYAAAAGLQFTVATYQRDDFDAMSRAVQRLFAVQEETVDTEQEGKTEVVYRQLRKFDAVFLPDDFKILKYFVKLFQYYTLAEIPVIGLHHWRAPQQLAANNLLLKGGFFIDFIGSYEQLPRGLSSATPTNLATIRQIDQRLLGYRGLAWLAHAIDATRQALRTNLNNKLTRKWAQRLSRRFSKAKHKLWQPQVISVAARDSASFDLR